MFELYFRSVDFDFSVTATSRPGKAAHLGFAIRPDTGFAELIAVASNLGVPDMLTPCLASSLHELRARNVLFLGTGTVPGEGALNTLLRMGFNRVSEQALLSKSIGGDD